MRKVQEVLRLLLVCGLSQRQASRASGVGRASVAEYVERVQKAGLLETWESLSGEELECRLYPPARRASPQAERPEADWAAVHEELKRRDMTLSLVWQEYREQHPDGYQYSRFCDLYRAWRGKLDLCMRQVHRPGEKLFVDYCGATVPVVDAGTGEVREAQVFVAVWGASSYTFAEATWSQGLADWIGSHVRALEFGGGCAGAGDPGQPAFWSDPCVPVRAGAEPDLPGPGHALRRGGDAGPGAQAARQGQSRSRRAAGPALDPGPPAAPDVFLARRAQPGDPRAFGSVERAAVSQASRLPAIAVREPRAAGSSTAARPSVSPTPSGRRCGSTSTITSRSKATTTACRISW